MEKEKRSVFETLNAINVSDKVEKKGNLSYLSWAWAWETVKKLFPNARYVIYENTLPTGYTINYFTDGKTAWVKTGVIIEELEHIEELPVMDFRNKSITFDNITSFDVNKAIQRSLTKALARHGLGLYIYAGEDLPSEEKEDNQKKSVDKTMEKEQLAYAKLRTELTKLGVDYRDDQSVVNWICEKAKVEHQDNTKLTLEEMKRLNMVYRTLKEQKELKINDKTMETF